MRRRRRKAGVLEPLGRLLRKVYPAPSQLEAAKVFAWWNRAVPPRVIEHARPVRLSHGVLTVHVTSSVWAQELHYLTHDLLARLQASHPQSKVQKIRFKVGVLPELPARRIDSSPPPPPIHLVSLPDELGRALSRIHDDALREIVTRAATTGLARAHMRSPER